MTNEPKTTDLCPRHTISTYKGVGILYSPHKNLEYKEESSWIQIGNSRKPIQCFRDVQTSARGIGIATEGQRGALSRFSQSALLIDLPCSIELMADDDINFTLLILFIKMSRISIEHNK